MCRYESCSKIIFYCAKNIQFSMRLMRTSFSLLSILAVMGSPDSDRVGSTTLIPFYSSTPHTAMLRALEDEEENIKPPRGLPGAPERSLQGVYWDALLNDESSWRLKATTPCSLPACRAPEQRPVVNSQAQAIGSSAGLEGQLEERSLEQVQTMVVGEVMKDIETACKLLNITPGKEKFSHLMLPSRAINQTNC